MLDTDADDAVRSIGLVLRAVDAGEQGDPPDLTSDLKDVLMLNVTVIDTNVAPVFDNPSRQQTHASVSEGAAGRHIGLHATARPTKTATP